MRSPERAKTTPVEDTGGDTVMRSARMDDWDDVRDFCTRTFSWGDYIEEVWDDWVDGGGLIVCEEDGAILGISHLALAGDEAWMEGIRVRPSARRRGIGSALLARMECIAVSRGAVHARAAIETTNTRSLAMFGSLGYRPGGDWYMYACRAAPGGCRRVERAPPHRWPERYVKSWMWMPLDSGVPPDRVVWIRDGPVAVLADSERFPGTIMATVSHQAGWDGDGGRCIIDYAAGLAHRTGQSLQVFSTAPLSHECLNQKEYDIRIMAKRMPQDAQHPV